MQMNIFEGILIPFAGTTLGAACVFFMRKTLSKSVQRALAAGMNGHMAKPIHVDKLLLTLAESIREQEKER